MRITKSILAMIFMTSTYENQVLSLNHYQLWFSLTGMNFQPSPGDVQLPWPTLLSTPHHKIIFSITQSFHFQLKGIFSDSNNIFLWHQPENTHTHPHPHPPPPTHTQKKPFQNFSWYQFTYKLYMIMCIGIAPSTNCTTTRQRDFMQKMVLIS